MATFYERFILGDSPSLLTLDSPDQQVAAVFERGDDVGFKVYLIAPGEFRTYEGKADYDRIYRFFHDRKRWGITRSSELVQGWTRNDSIDKRWLGPLVKNLQKALVKRAPNRMGAIMDNVRRARLVELRRSRFGAAALGSPERLMQQWADSTASGKALASVGKALEAGQTPDPSAVKKALTLVALLFQGNFDKKERSEFKKMKTKLESLKGKAAGYRPYGARGGDPRWMKARYPGVDLQGRPFRKGDQILYYPLTKLVLTGREADKAWREFESAAADEAFGGRMAARMALQIDWHDRRAVVAVPQHHKEAVTRYNVDGELLTKAQMMSKAKSVEVVFMGSDSKPTFHAVMPDGNSVFKITQADFEKSKLKDSSSAQQKKKFYAWFIKSKAKGLSMADAVEFNTWAKGKSEEQKIEKLRRMGAHSFKRVASKALTEKSLVDFLKSNPSGVTVASLAYAFGGHPQSHTKFLAKLVSKGVLVKDGKTYKLKGTPKKAIRRDPTKIDAPEARAWVEVILKSVGDKAKDHIDYLNGEIADAKRAIKEVDHAWAKWDWRDLIDLGLVSRDDADFVREVKGLYSW